MYAREIDGKIYDFGVSGKLIMNVLVMYDRQTETYWSQLLGEAVEGELAGTKLEFVTSWFTTWDEWKTQNPSTLALDKRSSRSTDSYTNYYSNDNAGIIGEEIDDNRLERKAFVIGVAHEGKAIAYPFSVLSREQAINDEIGNLPILIHFVTNGNTGIVYERKIDDQILTFIYDNERNELRDLETNSLWDGWQGIATEGELEGKQLRRVPSTRSFWFGWKDWYVNTYIYVET